ncbi:MAG: tripartite tricarboxylate transporter substrate binding protein [Burkholderiales bacterium]|nr:tripartite tricarboxylate transporter substrate binding protein [Burkholderiales bacterium]
MSRKFRYFHALLRSALFVLTASLVLMPLRALAENGAFPMRPMQLVVLFPAGSSADVTARVLAEGMSKRLKTNIIVVNRPGGGGAIGYKYAANQPADGYTMVWNSNSISTTYHTGMLSISYKAFDPVARVTNETPVLAVRQNAPWKTFADFVADARKNPGKITVGNSGIGSHTHISSVGLFSAAGVKVLDVPFPGAQIVPTLLGGEIDAVIQLPGALAGLVNAGTMRLLVALSNQRDPSFPSVPTAREVGINMSAELWRGVVVPRGTPKKIVATLEDAVRKTVESPEFAKACQRLYVSPAFQPGADFGKIIAEEDVTIGRMIAALGLEKPVK